MANSIAIHKYLDAIERLPRYDSTESRLSWQKKGEYWNQDVWITAWSENNCQLGGTLVKGPDGKLYADDVVPEYSFQYQRTEVGAFCGSAHCLAGEVAIDTLPVGSKLNVGSFSSAEVKLPNGDRTTIRQWATQQLELTEDQADALFKSYNSIKDMRELADRYGME